VGRPLAQMSSAIQAQQQQRLQAIEVPPGASSEVASLAESFNELARAVHEADETKQLLLAGVSHDLRTPLARLRLRIETQCEPLLGQPLADELQADLHALERIVSQFLAYVQGEGASANLGALESADALAAQVVASYAAQKLRVAIEGDRAGREAGLRSGTGGGRENGGEDGRESRREDGREWNHEEGHGNSTGFFPLPDLALQRLLTNLIDNALAHGRAPVAVALEAERATGGLRLTVWDHGSGMSAEEFERAKRPFVRLPGARAVLGHCGLGLAIVAQVARQTGATLSCTRDAAGRFGIELRWPAPPLAPAAPTAPQPHTAARAGPTA
jgi:two-component system, OmpR family, osmolarity sensor histidine kinase EnvZ